MKGDRFMISQRFKLSLIASVVFSFMLVVGGCGTNSSTRSNDATSSEDTAANKGIKIGMVTDTGGVNDKSFNQSVWETLLKVKQETGVSVKYLQSKNDQDYAPNLNQFIKGQYDLIWAVGAPLKDATEKAAAQNPERHIAIVDEVVNAPNVKSITFAEEEGSYLVGIVAGLMTKTNKIGFVGGMELPLIKKFQLGFAAGVAAVNPKAKVSVNYTGDFSRPDLGKAAAATIYNDGADIIYHASGATGTGVFNEAMSRKKQGNNVWVIGVDQDQSKLFGHDITLTSMIKRVDRAVDKVCKEVIKNDFKGGEERFTLKDDGVGLPDTNKNVPKDVLEKVELYKQKIINGEIKVPFK